MQLKKGECMEKVLLALSLVGSLAFSKSIGYYAELAHKCDAGNSGACRKVQGACAKKDVNACYIVAIKYEEAGNSEADVDTSYRIVCNMGSPDACEMVRLRANVAASRASLEEIERYQERRAAEQARDLAADRQRALSNNNTGMQAAIQYWQGQANPPQKPKMNCIFKDRASGGQIGDQMLECEQE